MYRFLWTLVAVLSLVAGRLASAATPAVVGNLQGVELAQQTDISPALFLGLFQGTVDGKPAFGVWMVAVLHQVPLPAKPGQSINVTGGEWIMPMLVVQGITLKEITLGGGISGKLSYFDVGLFSLATTLSVKTGGTGNIALNGRLDHNVFPPVVTATLSQPVVIKQ